MLRTNKEWYNLLSPKDRVLFNQNCNQYFYLHGDIKDTKYNFLNKAFLWNATPQGHDYWSKIANSKD